MVTDPAGGTPPTVSIILPTYNRAQLLPRAVRSVLAQTYQDFELIIVDDGSTDETADVVAPFLSERVQYLRRPANRGVSGARNIGIAHATGEFLAFQDSDDEWLPEKLERQMAVFRDADASVCVVYCDMERVHADGTRRPFPVPPCVTPRMIDRATGFYGVEGLGPQMCVIRRACLDSDALFDERLRVLDDLDFFLRLSQRHRFYHLEQSLVRYYETEGLTSSARRRYSGRADLLRRHWPSLIRAHPVFLFRELFNVARGSWRFRHGLE